MTRAEALAELRESRDGTLIWHDNGATVTRLAHTARVTVIFVHVNLSALTTERLVVEGKGANDERDNAF